MEKLNRVEAVTPGDQVKVNCPGGRLCCSERENMKIQGLAVILIILICAGCTRISLKRLDQDIPSVLLEKYKLSTTEYADAGNCFLFPLLVGSERVAKTEKGFQAYQHRNFGLLLADTTKYADYDKQGQLIRFGCSGSYLTPLIYNTWCGKIRVHDEFKEEYTKKLLLGCLGTQMKTSGERLLIVLWIPCPIPTCETYPN